MSQSVTTSGGTTPSQFTGGGSQANFNQFLNGATTYTVFTGTGVSTVTGPVVLGSTNTAVTVSGASAVADTTAGGNVITTQSATTVYAAPNDTVSSAAATTLLGANGGVTSFSLGGSGTSVTGGSGGIVGTVSGANSTLVGGTGTSIYHISGANTLAVAGSAGITGIDASKSTGPETIVTNPLGNFGTLVAILGSGADSVIGGGGASTITAGSGHDAFLFVKGHAGGSEVIIGFTASDNFGFAGYGYTAGNLPAEHVGSIGDVITLSDGTTITLAGVFHKIF